ncbi:linear amide C-N hydrolase [Candidatus Bathyarchaeota archaeon]|nr:linear amide C-N hydrolase [Candidatus Bathyarchaeota archaeon]
MKVYDVRGTTYEIGFQMGDQFRKQNREIPHYSERKKSFALKTADEIKDVVPELIEEIRGFADGGKYDHENILTHTLTLGRCPGCTVFAVDGVHTRDRKTLFARNYDGPEFFQHFDLYKIYPKGYYSHMGCVFDMIVGREDGINEKGLAIAATGVRGKYNSRPGVWDHIAVRAVLDNCGNTEEAASLLMELPHLWTKNFLVADSRSIMVVEAAQQGVNVIRPENGFGVITNHFTSEEMKRFNDDGDPMYKTYERHDQISKWFERKKDDLIVDDIKRILNDPERGVLSNFRGEKESKSFVTVWSWIATTGERSFSLSKGTPIDGIYEDFYF